VEQPPIAESAILGTIQFRQCPAVFHPIVIVGMGDTNIA
jgi:hypothetical protein